MKQINARQLIEARLLLIKKMEEFGNEIYEELEIYWPNNYAYDMADAALSVFKAISDTQLSLKKEGFLEN